MSEEQIPATETETITPESQAGGEHVEIPAQKQEPKLANRTLKGLDADGLEMIAWARSEFSGNQTESIMKGLAFARAAKTDVKVEPVAAEEQAFDIAGLIDAVTDLGNHIDRQTEMLQPLVTMMVEEAETSLEVSREHLAFLERLSCEAEKHGYFSSCEKGIEADIDAGEKGKTCWSGWSTKKKPGKGKKAKKKPGKSSKKKVR